MFRILSVLTLATILSASWLQAVEVGSAYDSTAPTSTDIADWDSGWGASDVTGWDYVGSVNGASGVYLGNGFVLTAGHVGAGDFVLDGQTYDVVAGSGQQIGTADLNLFQIDTTSTTGTALTLPALTLALNPPTAFSSLSTGSSVVMIGYGGSNGETWGEDTINYTNQATPLTVGSTVYNSVDFYTVDGTSIAGTQSITNNAQLVAGDSGGGDFIFNATTKQWELAGINEVQLEDENKNVVGSGMVQLNNYSTTIEGDMAIAAPEPPAWQLLGLGIVLAGTLSCFCRRHSLFAAKA